MVLTSASVVDRVAAPGLEQAELAALPEPGTFTLVALFCGTVPLLSFWAEHRATKRVRAGHPELR